jgi:hypothetical protein
MERHPFFFKKKNKDTKAIARPAFFSAGHTPSIDGKGAPR